MHSNVGTAPAGVEPGISEELLYKKLGFTPHSAGQSEYLYSKARFNIPCCGRRYGKSQAAGHRMTYKSFKQDSINWIIGTSYRIGEKEFRVIWSDYSALGLLKYCKKSYSKHQGDMHIETPWGGSIQVVSADNPDSLLGEGVSHAILSESAKHNRSTWEQYVEPTLADLRGSCDFPSTPQGYNWYHGLWMIGQEANMFRSPAPTDTTTPHTPNTPNHTSLSSSTSLKPDQLHSLSQYRSWQLPTWENTFRFPGGFNDPEIQRVMKRVSPVWFMQEYGAEFTSLTGAIFEEWDPNVHIIDDYNFDPSLPNFLTFDYGFANPFVCLDIQILPDNTVIVWREYYNNQAATMVHGQAIKDRENPTDYHVDGMWGDPRGADEAATLALILGNVASQDVRWKLSVEQMKRMLSARPTKILVHKSCVNLTRQMAKLHVKEQSKQAKFDLNEQQGDGNIQHKVDDHAVDALRYFIGPYFVLGAGSHLSDVYGEEYIGSESHDFFTLNSGFDTVMDDTFTLMR